MDIHNSAIFEKLNIEINNGNFQHSRFLKQYFAAANTMNTICVSNIFSIKFQMFYRKTAICKS